MQQFGPKISETKGRFRDAARGPRRLMPSIISAQTAISLCGVNSLDVNRKNLGCITALAVTAVFTALSGCQSTGVIQMDQDSYFIGKKDGTPGIGVSLSNKAEVFREANDFCHDRGLAVKTLHVTTVPAMPAQLGSTELQFKCVPPAAEAQSTAKAAG